MKDGGAEVMVIDLDQRRTIRRRFEELEDLVVHSTGFALCLQNPDGTRSVVLEGSFRDDQKAGASALLEAFWDLKKGASSE